VTARRLATAGLLVAVVATLGCHKEAADCTPPPATLPLPDACPSFTEVFNQVFLPVCDNCHAPKQQEASMPLTTYAQIFGPTSGPNQGSEAMEIYNQVFLSCLMPPSNAPVPLTVEARQLLLDWFACGATNDSGPTADAGAGD